MMKTDRLSSADLELVRLATFARDAGLTPEVLRQLEGQRQQDLLRLELPEPALDPFAHQRAYEEAERRRRIELAEEEERARIRVREKHEAGKRDEPSAAAAEPVLAVRALGTGKIWDADRLAQLNAYRTQHGTKKAAEHFGVTPSRVRALLPTGKPATKGYSAFTHRLK